MKKNLPFIVLVLLMTTIAGIAQTPVAKDYLDKIINQEKHNNAWKLHALSNPLTDNYDLIYARYEWYINPAVDSIKGKITYYFKTLNNSFNQINFDCSDFLVIDYIRYHNQTISFSLVTGDLLQVNLPSIIPINNIDSVTIQYEGVPVSTGFGSFNTTYHNLSPVLWTLSEPYGAQDWMPCKNSLTDKIDSIDILVTTPMINRVASNGVLVEELNQGSDKLYHWKHRHPIATYLIGISVTNYSYYSNYVPYGNDSFEVLNYVYPEYDSIARVKTPDIVNVIKLYDSLIGLYPFHDEKYGHAQFSWGGGMEHQTMSFVAGFENALIAHECAHQWFGDRITCGSWEDIWLNEGFATFMEGITEKYLFPDAWKGLMKSRVTTVCSDPSGSVKVNDTTDVGRIFDGRLSYNKGSLLLRMLEWKLGDSVFFQSLRNYLNDPLLSYRFARTADLKRNLELTSGQNLDNFFNEWYTNQGFPSYRITWNQIGSKVSFTVDQTTSDPSVSFFEMPIPIEFTGNGRDAIITFNHVYSGQSFTTILDYHVKDLIFDPDSWIISDNNTIIHLPQISISPNPFMDDFAIYIEGINTNSNIDVTLFDVLGNKVWAKTGSANDLIINSPINLRSGVYVLKLKCNDININKKIIKT